MKSILMALSLMVITLFSAQEMETNFEKAKEQAQASNRNVVLVFTGSDWCVPCMKLEKYILSTDDFKNAIEEEYVLINADIPQKKKNKALQSAELQAQNKELADQYNPNGYFPFVVVFDEDMNVVGNLTYEEVSPNEYAKMIAAFK